jgi:adenylate cyclase, class 2
MKQTNIEIKAKCPVEKQDRIRKILKDYDAEYKGTDSQLDIYFKVDEGRLKVRRGDIEYSLIFYNRENKREAKESDIELYPLKENSLLERMIWRNHNVLVQVEKSREIYFIDNVKFHLDNVKNLGTFVEIEAISKEDKIPKERLQRQCDYYKNLLGISDGDLIGYSYSDMLLLKEREK